MRSQPSLPMGKAARSRVVAGALFVAASSLAAPASAQLDATEDLMRRLTEAPGPPAFEEEVRRIVTDEMEA
ncbi:MAG: hypothetical protein HKO98_04270, partial [Gemmatimonadetes bacterium]|nr:hypothetical protein [Gemmatimonadota bacterium]